MEESETVSVLSPSFIKEFIIALDHVQELCQHLQQSILSIENDPLFLASQIQKKVTTLSFCFRKIGLYLRLPRNNASSFTTTLSTHTLSSLSASEPTDSSVVNDLRTIFTDICCDMNESLIAKLFLAPKILSNILPNHQSFPSEFGIIIHHSYTHLFTSLCLCLQNPDFMYFLHDYPVLLSLTTPTVGGGTTITTTKLSSSSTSTNTMIGLGDLWSQLFHTLSYLLEPTVSTIMAFSRAVVSLHQPVYKERFLSRMMMVDAGPTEKNTFSTTSSSSGSTSSSTTSIPQPDNVLYTALLKRFESQYALLAYQLLGNKSQAIKLPILVPSLWFGGSSSGSGGGGTVVQTVTTMEGGINVSSVNDTLPSNYFLSSSSSSSSTSSSVSRSSSSKVDTLNILFTALLQVYDIVLIHHKDALTTTLNIVWSTLAINAVTELETCIGAWKLYPYYSCYYQPFHTQLLFGIINETEKVESLLLSSTSFETEFPSYRHDEYTVKSVTLVEIVLDRFIHRIYTESNAILPVKGTTIDKWTMDNAWYTSSLLTNTLDPHNGDLSSSLTDLWKMDDMPSLFTHGNSLPSLSKEMNRRLNVLRWMSLIGKSAWSVWSNALPVATTTAAGLSVLPSNTTIINSTINTMLSPFISIPKFIQTLVGLTELTYSPWLPFRIVRNITDNNNVSNSLGLPFEIASSLFQVHLGKGIDESPSSNGSTAAKSKTAFTPAVLDRLWLVMIPMLYNSGSSNGNNNNHITVSAVQVRMWHLVLQSLSSNPHQHSYGKLILTGKLFTLLNQYPILYSFLFGDKELVVLFNSFVSKIIPLLLETSWNCTIPINQRLIQSTVNLLVQQQQQQDTPFSVTDLRISLDPVITDPLGYFSSSIVTPLLTTLILSPTVSALSSSTTIAGYRLLLNLLFSSHTALRSIGKDVWIQLLDGNDTTVIMRSSLVSAITSFALETLVRTEQEDVRNTAAYLLLHLIVHPHSTTLMEPYVGDIVRTILPSVDNNDDINIMNDIVSVDLSLDPFGSSLLRGYFSSNLRFRSLQSILEMMDQVTDTNLIIPGTMVTFRTLIQPSLSSLVTFASKGLILYAQHINLETTDTDTPIIPARSLTDASSSFLITFFPLMKLFYETLLCIHKYFITVSNIDIPTEPNSGVIRTLNVSFTMMNNLLTLYATNTDSIENTENVSMESKKSKRDPESMHPSLSSSLSSVRESSLSLRPVIDTWLQYTIEFATIVLPFTTKEQWLPCLEVVYRYLNAVPFGNDESASCFPVSLGNAIQKYTEQVWQKVTKNGPPSAELANSLQPLLLKINAFLFSHNSSFTRTIALTNAVQLAYPMILYSKWITALWQSTEPLTVTNLQQQTGVIQTTCQKICHRLSTFLNLSPDQLEQFTTVTTEYVRVRLHNKIVK